ncbi:MAG TPA: hypothetical protein VJJ51_14380 [Candidatus Methanoperedens sp.]|nr:hypothetical protein [Candidatus Methanoperedens sp.]HLB72226.1 hypothetical protein [Candidatus Methanoperedens sp.]
MKKQLAKAFYLLLTFSFIFVNSAAGSLEITDFFSDFTSSEVSIKSDQAHQGKAVFELMYGGNAVESQVVPFEVNAGEQISKVIIWQKKPQHDYYTARVSLYNDTQVHDSSSYAVSYGTVAMPSFHVVDFSPSNRGVQLLLRPFNPGAVDIKIELLENNDIVFTETKEDVSLTSNTELKIDWPFLLSNNRNYNVRAKILTHRLSAPPLVNTYTASFVANDDVEIVQDDVEVDEYGASVTLRGRSQVPFDGFIDVAAKNRDTNERLTFRQQIEDILVYGKEDTAGVVWKNLVPGTYDIEIRAVNKENIALDKYETVLRIPEEAVSSETPTVKSTPGFTALILLIALFAAAWKWRGG